MPLLLDLDSISRLMVQHDVDSHHHGVDFLLMLQTSTYVSARLWHVLPPRHPVVC